jgi:hypothetical protein
LALEIQVLAWDRHKKCGRVKSVKGIPTLSLSVNGIPTLSLSDNRIFNDNINIH